MNKSDRDPEAELASAAAAFSAVMTVIESHGGDRKSTSRPANLVSTLRAELHELNLESKAVLESDLVTDAELRALAARYRRASALLFDALISVAPGATM